MIDAWEGLGFSLSDLGRAREAIARARRGVKIDPMRSGTHLAWRGSTPCRAAPTAR